MFSCLYFFQVVYNLWKPGQLKPNSSFRSQIVNIVSCIWNEQFFRNPLPVITLQVTNYLLLVQRGRNIFVDFVALSNTLIVLYRHAFPVWNILLQYNSSSRTHMTQMNGSVPLENAKTQTTKTLPLATKPIATATLMTSNLHTATGKNI